MNQTTLFRFPPATRRTDPDSSRQAELEITCSGARVHQAEIVLDLVRRKPGRTSAEYSMHCNLDRWQIARRLPELAAAGLAHKGAMRKCGLSKRSGLTWWPGRNKAVAS